MSVHHDIPGEIAKLERFIRALPGTLKAASSVVFTRLAARATSTFMRDAGPEAGPRSATDAGPLRIVRSRLARSLLGAAYRGLREGIRRVQLQGFRLSLVFGTSVPYAGVHEEGFAGSVVVPAHQRSITQAFGRSITPTVVNVRPHSRRMNTPARPFLAPSLRAELPGIERHYAQAAASLLTKHLRGV